MGALIASVSFVFAAGAIIVELFTHELIVQGGHFDGKCRQCSLIKFIIFWLNTVTQDTTAFFQLILLSDRRH